MTVLSFMKRNPFRLLFTEPGLFLSDNVGLELDLDSHLKIHYCSHNHPLLINTSESEGITCPLKGCGDTIARTSSKLRNARNTKHVWFILWRYYTSPKKAEPDNLKPLTPILLRLLYHLLLFLRNEGVSQNKNKIQELVKQTNKQDTSDFLWKQIKQDFKRLKIQTKLNEELLNFSEKFETWYPQGLACDTLSEIYEFEKKLDKEYSTFFYSRANFIKLRNKSEIIANDNKEFKELMDEIEEIEEKNERHEIDNFSQLFLKTQSLSWRDLIP
ncbi:hypothetical protein RFI_34989, partial [Reticulomyxa filosa]